MTYSLRSALAGIGVIAVWLAALLSGSQLFVAGVSFLATMTILLALPLAIFELRPATRAFWTGFFVTSLGLLLFNSFTVGSASWAYRSVRDSIADVLTFERPRPESNQEFVPAPPSMYSGDGTPPFVSRLSIARHEERTILINGVNICLAWFAGLAGGWVCYYYYCSRVLTGAATSQVSGRG